MAYIIIFLYLYISHLVAKRAYWRGESYIKWLFISLLLTPIGGFVLLLLVDVLYYLGHLKYVMFVVWPIKIKFFFYNPLKKGCIVYCDLAVVAEHSGIYIGGSKIVHLDGNGEIEKVNFFKFLERLDGFNPATKIYYSCDEKGKTIKNKEIANRAKSMVGRSRDYHVLLDNCHQFTSGCITGNFENTDNFMTFLKDTAQNQLGVKQWKTLKIK